MAFVIYNGVECYCLPDCACCKLCHKLISEIDDCPDGNEYCNAGECDYYDEIWDNNELKEELDKDEDKIIEKEINENDEF